MQFKHTPFCRVGYCGVCAQRKQVHCGSDTVYLKYPARGKGIFSEHTEDRQPGDSTELRISAPGCSLVYTTPGTICSDSVGSHSHRKTNGPGLSGDCEHHLTLLCRETDEATEGSSTPSV